MHLTGHRFYRFYLAVLLVFLSAVAQATVIQRTITVDGDVSEWESAPAIINFGTNPSTGNAGQFSIDPEGASCPSDDRDAFDTGELSGNCNGLQGAGRDLKTFAFTYDSTNLYLYVERYASATNVTDWWFYIDTDNDGLMETTDVLYRVGWQGSNQTTTREIWTYDPVNPSGDFLVGGSANVADGHDMPGDISPSSSFPSITGGAANGTSMETFIPWALLCGSVGCPPQSVRFHISSSNGTNLPNNVIDNMDGPGGVGGGAITILDLGVGITASKTTVASGAAVPTFTYTTSLINNGGGNATNVGVQLAINTAFEFVSAAPSVGTYNSGTGLWSGFGLVANATANLVVTVRPIGAESSAYAATATITALDQADNNAANDDALVNVGINFPDLKITKFHSGDFAEQVDGSFQIEVENLAGSGAYPGVITIEDTLPAEFPLVSASGSGWLCGSYVSNVLTCTYGSAASVLAAGTKTTPLVVVVNPVDTSGAIVSPETEPPTYNNVVKVLIPSASGANIQEFNSGNNTVTDGTRVLEVANLADISVAKSVSSGTPLVADNIVYTVSATNNGPNNASNLKITDALPAGVTYVSSSGGTAYDSGAGVWTVGVLNNGQTKQVTITGSVDLATGGSTITNTASLFSLNQLDNNSANNSASISIVPREFNLSTSAKTAVDVNGGQVNPGDILRFSITLRETGGVAATGIKIFDNLPASTTSLSNIVVSNGSGAIVTPSAYDLEMENLTVAANGTTTVSFDTVVKSSAAAFAAIINSATIEDSNGAQRVLVSTPTLTVVRGLTKELYLGPATAVNAGTYGGGSPAFGASTMTRFPAISTTPISINAGASRVWRLDLPLAAALILEDVPGSNLPVQLAMERVSNGSTSARVSLYKDLACTGSIAPADLLATSGDVSVLSSTSTVETFSLDLSADLVLAAGNCLTLEVFNTNGSGKTFSVLPSNGSLRSKIDLKVFNYIDVDKVEVFDNTGTLVTSSNFGEEVYFRATISDPFGYYDISAAQFTLRDGAGNVSIAPVAMVVNAAESMGAKKYFYYPAVPVIAPGGFTTLPAAGAAPAGNWSASVTASEGTENAIFDTGSSVFNVQQFPPLLNVIETVDDNTVTPGQIITYSIEVRNINPGEAYSVVVSGNVGAFLSLRMLWAGTPGDENVGPFSFSEGASSSALLVPAPAVAKWYYAKGGGFIDPAITPLSDGCNGASSGFDGCVTDFKLEMDGIMNPRPGDSLTYSSFFIKYQVQLR
jgi:uncharacterized repeat protein (TIGR01451 family)